MPYPIGAVQGNCHITPVEGGINVVPLFGLQAGVETGSAFVGAIIDFVLCLNAQKRVVQVIGQNGIVTAFMGITATEAPRLRCGQFRQMRERRLPCLALVAFPMKMGKDLRLVLVREAGK